MMFSSHRFGSLTVHADLILLVFLLRDVESHLLTQAFVGIWMR